MLASPTTQLHLVATCENCATKFAFPSVLSEVVIGSRVVIYLLICPCCHHEGTYRGNRVERSALDTKQRRVDVVEQL
jgi:hypothetical protein